MDFRILGRISNFGYEFTWIVDDFWTHLQNMRLLKICSNPFEFDNGIWVLSLQKSKYSYKNGDSIKLFLTTPYLTNFDLCFELGAVGGLSHRRQPSKILTPRCKKERSLPWLIFTPSEIDLRNCYTFEFFVNFKNVCNCNIVTAPLSVKQPEELKEDLKCNLQEPQASKSKSVCKLQEDLKQLLLSKKDSDVILKMEGREFKAHRNILGIRSPVFSAMFHYDMAERQNGVVDIEDCNSDTFNDFLVHMYTGSVELRSENAVTLYSTADKYQMEELKAECLDYMKNNVSVENFCDFLSLSLRYCETELTDIVTQFFVRKAADIALTDKWQVFMAANLVVANELFLKSLKAKKQ